MSTHLCANGGYLVGAELPYPDEGHVYQPAYPPLVGCTLLGCNLCGAVAIAKIGFRDAPGAHDHVAEVYASADWASTPWVTRDPAWRLYACKCTLVAISDKKATPMPGGGWACRGHPFAKLPVIEARAFLDAAVLAVNMQLQQRLDAFDVTYTDGTRIGGWPERVSMGSVVERIDLLEYPTQARVLAIELARVARVTVLLRDGSSQRFG